LAKVNLLELETEQVIGSLRGLVEVWYSTNNCGKTYNFSKMPKPLLIACEAGARGVSCPTVHINSWGDFMDTVKQLTDPKTLEEMQNRYETIGIDTLEMMVMFSDNAVSQRYGVGTLSEITGKENGWTISRSQIAIAIQKLVSASYHIIFLSHEEAITMTDEISGEEYEFIVPKQSKNEKSSARFIRDIADVVVYLMPHPYDVENDREVLSTAIYKRTKSCFARSRFSDLPFCLPNFNAREHQKILLEAIEARAKKEECGVTDYESTKPTTCDEWKEKIKPLFKKVYNFNVDMSTEIIESQLGSGMKISNATDDDCVKLENIYNSLLTYVVQFNL
jgi:hypothetical protein